MGGVRPEPRPRGDAPGAAAREGRVLTTATIPVEVASWVTKFIGGDGTGRRVFEEAVAPGATVRSVLRRLAARYPDLDAALWHGDELGEHIEVLVNEAVLGLGHSLDSPLRPGDRITLLGQFMGGC